MKREDFLKAFAVAPLAFVSKEQAESLKARDSVAVIMNIDGKQHALAFHLDISDDIDVKNQAFQALIRVSEETFMREVIFKETLKADEDGWDGIK